MSSFRVQRLSDLTVDHVRNVTQGYLDNARSDALIRQRLAERGWEAAKLDALQSVIDDFDASARTFDALKNQRDSAAEDFTTELDAFRRGRFRSLVRLVNSAFIDDASTRRRLGLDDGLDTLNDAFPTWHTRASDFFRELLGDEALQEALTDYKITVDEIQSVADETDRLKDLYQQRTQLDANRQQARRDRDAQRQVLETEIRRFQGVAEVVLADRPDLLEQLGFTVPS